MRVKITVDSATTEEIRALCVSLHRAGLTGELSVGVEGPDCWGGSTPKMSADQARVVVADLARRL